MENFKEQVIAMYTNGKSINQIRLELNCSWDRVKKTLVNENILLSKSVNQYSKGNGVSDELFKKISNSESAYWLGVLYADGSVRTDRNEISLDMIDKEHIEKFKVFCNSSNSIREHRVKRKESEYISWAFSFSNKEVKENLIKLGCVPKKSLILKFPNEEQVPNEYLSDFIRGYIDGDGYFQFDPLSRKYRIIICGTKDFLEGLNIRFNVNGRIRKDSNSKIFTLNIEQKESVKNILTLLYENSEVYLKRKYEVYQSIKILF